MPYRSGPLKRVPHEFSEEELADIRRTWSNGEASLRNLAERYGCDHMKIFRIVHGHTPRAKVQPRATLSVGKAIDAFLEEAKTGVDLHTLARVSDMSYTMAEYLVKGHIAEKAKALEGPLND